MVNQSSSPTPTTRLIDPSELILIQNPVEFEGPVKFLELVETPLEAVDSSTAPSVLNNTKIVLSASSPITITNFRDGQEGQTIFVVGDGNSTVQHGTNIFTNSGANKLLVSGSVYIFTLVNGEWREVAGVVASVTPPQTINIPVGELHTSSSAGSYQEYPNTQVWYRAIADLEGFTEFRVLFTTRNVVAPSGMTIRIQYSLNNSTWNTFWTSSSFLSDSTVLGTYAVIPAGALGPTVYFRVQVSAPNSGSDTVRITSLQVQVRP